MNALNAAMTVIGAGSYGTALAITLARNGHHVVLWGHDPKHIATLQHDRCNAAFLPDVPFPDTLHLESDLATALAAAPACQGLTLVDGAGHWLQFEYAEAFDAVLAGILQGD